MTRAVTIGLAALSGLAVVACAGAEEAEPPPVDVGEGGAVMVATSIFTADNFNTYVGVYPEMPSGALDTRRMREFGNANVSTFDGYVFVEEDGVMTRFSVSDSLELVEGPRFSWANYGITSGGATYAVFVSATRAYVFAPDLGIVIVWNPEAMEVTGTLPLALPDRPPGQSTYAYDGRLVGDRVIWNVVSVDWENYDVHRATTLAVANAQDDAPVRWIEDTRCTGGGTSRVDERGDLYIHAGANLGFFAAYGAGADSARTCMLRVNSGAEQFDPDYMVDYEALTGSKVSYPWVHVQGEQWLAISWDPAVAMPEDPDLFWDNAALRPLLVDVRNQNVTPYPDLENSLFVSGIPFVVDGMSYFERSETGYTEDGNADIVELHPEGARAKFHITGSLYALERVR